MKTRALKGRDDRAQGQTGTRRRGAGRSCSRCTGPCRCTPGCTRTRSCPQSWAHDRGRVSRPGWTASSGDLGELRRTAPWRQACWASASPAKTPSLLGTANGTRRKTCGGSGDGRDRRTAEILVARPGDGWPNLPQLRLPPLLRGVRAAGGRLVRRRQCRKCGERRTTCERAGTKSISSLQTD